MASDKIHENTHLLKMGSDKMYEKYICWKMASDKMSENQWFCPDPSRRAVDKTSYFQWFCPAKPCVLIRRQKKWTRAEERENTSSAHPHVLVVCFCDQGRHRSVAEKEVLYELFKRKWFGSRRRTITELICKAENGNFVHRTVKIATANPKPSRVQSVEG